jgi:cellulose synthase/poly-beta-1,6-N-acetylglucosamine synthase-like glycosyltransferase
MAFSATSSSSSMMFLPVFYGITGVCDFLLAIFLMICGILVLRNSPHARRGHLIYAGLKIPIALVEVVVYVWMMKSVFASMSTAGGANAFVIISAAIQGAISCAYPIALLIVMNQRSVKEYYQSRF